MQVSKQLLGELATLRSRFAAPHEAIVERRSYQQGNAVSSYRDSLAFYQPAVAQLAEIVASGQLDAARAAAQESARLASGNPFASLAISTLKNLDTLTSGQEADWSGAGLSRLCEGLGDDPARHGAELDAALSREIFIGADREKLHPEPFLGEGPLTADKLEGLSQWMVAEGDRQAARFAERDQQSQATWAAVEATQDELNSHWRSRNQGKGERIELAKAFLSHLDAAEQAQPGLVREMHNLAPEFGIAKHFFPANVLDSYRAGLKRPEGPNWNKLLGQMERTSLS